MSMKENVQGTWLVTNCFLSSYEKNSRKHLFLLHHFLVLAQWNAVLLTQFVEPIFPKGSLKLLHINVLIGCDCSFCNLIPPDKITTVLKQSQPHWVRLDRGHRELASAKKNGPPSVGMVVATAALSKERRQQS